MTDSTAERTIAVFTASEKTAVLFEEYRALYGLAEFRLSSLDRRAMLAWAALGAFLTGFGAMDGSAQQAFLIGLPLAVFWLLRTTINHARSFEDALRRIDEIECAVNEIAGEQLLAFQSSHPSRGSAIGGRTGRETLLTVLMTGLAMLLACGYLASQSFVAHDQRGLLFYCGSLAVVALGMLGQMWSLRGYRYHATRAGSGRVKRSRLFLWRKHRLRKMGSSAPIRTSR